MTDESLVGQTLAGKYRVEAVLGKGGMGLVLGAHHLKLDEPVAIKLLRPAMMDLPGMVARFLREARAASKIKSDHVVRVTDVDTLDDGVPYMVMERLTGTDFSELRKEKGTFAIAEAVGYVLEAADAIAEAHALGIVHRDLKPSNLFLHRLRDGRSVVKVLDFGISKVEAPGEQDTTKTGQMMGSPKYMSPEQMLSMRDVDGRSDIWSLGALLYELLAGRPPFVADTTPRICALVLNTDPRPPSELREGLPPALERVVLRCLEKEPDRRFATVGALVEALAPFGPTAPALVRTGDPTLVLAAPAPAAEAPRPAASTPTPGAWDAGAKPEAAPRKGSGGRIAAAVLGVALAGGLAALYFAPSRWGETPHSPRPSRSGHEGASATALPAAQPSSVELAKTSGAETATAAVGAPSATAASEPARTAYNPSDLPDVRPAAPPRLPSSAGAGPVAKPKATANPDPFGGRRN